MPKLAKENFRKEISLKKDMMDKTYDTIRRRIVEHIVYKNKRQLAINNKFINEICKLVNVPLGIGEGAKLEVLHQIMEKLLNYWCIPKELISEEDLEKIL